MCTRIHLRPVLTLLLCLTFVLSALPVVADEAADREAIAAAAQQWTEAFNARDAAALTALSATDILVLDGRAERINTPALAAKAWLLAAAVTRGNIKTSDREIVVHGDTAWRVGSVAYQRSDGQWHKGESLEIWQRTRAGWKLHRQMSSHLIEHTLRPPPPGPMLDTPTN